jgi:hypothetical protein
MEMRLEESFWMQYLPYECTYIPSALEDGSGSSLTVWSKLRDQAMGSQTARLAFRATALMSLGRLRTNRDYAMVATRIYAQALRQVNNALQRSDACHDPATLAATRFLALFETFRVGDSTEVSSQAIDWQNHVHGMSRIIEIRGSEKVTTLADWNVITDARQSAAVCGIILKRPVGLATREWSRTFRGMHDHVAPSLRENLVDIMALIPNILDQQNRLYARMDSCVTADEHSKIAEDCMKLSADALRVAELLLAWEKHMLQFVLGKVDLSATDKAPELEPSVLSTYCRQLNYCEFDLTAQFWFACVMMFTRLAVFHENAQTWNKSMPFSYPLSLPTPLPERFAPAPYAASIARNAEHFFEPAAGLWGAEHAPICMAAASYYFAAHGLQTSAEMRLLQSVLSSPRARAFSLSFLKSLAVAATPEVANGNASRDPDRELMAQTWFGMRPIRHDFAQDAWIRVPGLWPDHTPLGWHAASPSSVYRHRSSWKGGINDSAGPDSH